MIDAWLEPPDDDWSCDCGVCDECSYEPDCDCDEEMSDREIEIAQFNYECMIYNEPERRIAR